MYAKSTSFRQRSQCTIDPRQVGFERKSKVCGSATLGSRRDKKTNPPTSAATELDAHYFVDRVLYNSPCIVVMWKVIDLRRSTPLVACRTANQRFGVSTEYHSMPDKLWSRLASQSQFQFRPPTNCPACQPHEALSMPGVFDAILIKPEIVISYML